MTYGTKLKFYSGTRTIGGTVLTIEHEGNRVILDFGRIFNPTDLVLQNGIYKVNDIVKTYLILGLLPPINNFYNKRNIPSSMDLTPLEEGSLNTAVFISHLHLDHMENMGLISPHIPIYMTEESLSLYNTLSKVNDSVVGSRSFDCISYNNTLSVGAIKITPLKVNHDIIGATSYFIETPDLKLFYSGDLTLGKDTLASAKKASDLNTDILIMESTTIGQKVYTETTDNREHDLVDRIYEQIPLNSSLIIFNIYNRNLHRINNFYNLSKKLGRKLVLELETAFIFSTLLHTNNFYIIDYDYNLDNFSKEAVDFYNSSKKISIELVNSCPKDYILQNSFHNLMYLLDINTSDSFYIHSNGVPLGDYDPKYNALRSFLNTIKVNYKYIGASGHANPASLKYIAETVNARWFMPIHGFYPENNHIATGIRLLPEERKTYVFSKGNLINVNIR